MKTVVSVGKSGRVTLPVKARRELGLREGSEMVFEVVDGVITLRPAVVMTREDAWAYTREHRAALAQARADADAGRVVQLSEEQLQQLFDARHETFNGQDVRLRIRRDRSGRKTVELVGAGQPSARKLVVHEQAAPAAADG
jgi:AbrB family looped-hinge helix DNA binding protein